MNLFFLSKAFLEERILIHDDAVDDVHEEEHDGLREGNSEIPAKKREHRQTDDIVRAIAEQWPPRQRDGFDGRAAAQADHKKNVEDSGTNYRAEAHVVLSDAGTDEGGKKFWGRAAGRHKRGTRDVGLDVPYVNHHLQRTSEIDVAHRVQTKKHIPDADAMKDHLEKPQWVFVVRNREYRVRGVQRIVLKPPGLSLKLSAARLRREP
mmetsp:Transcript_24985/g.69640  ORF Transcript_24985/g.69640 Transcript_24985/m.69640 type:complete len:207 (-) Transcript_24985:239-859(-)